MKKKEFYFGGLLVVSAILFIFASCTQEDDFIVDNGLDIDSQVPLTRSGGGDINPDSNILTNIDANSCCIIAIVNISRNNYHGQWPEGESAQQKYDDVMYYAEHTLGYEKGQPMSDEMFSNLASHYNYGGNVSGQESVVNYFNHHKNGNKIVKYQVYNVQTGQLEGHRATVFAFDRDSTKQTSLRFVDVYNEQGIPERVWMNQIEQLNYYEVP